MKAKVQTGGFSLLSAEQVTGNSALTWEEFKVRDAAQVLSWRDMWQVDGAKSSCGGL